MRELPVELFFLVATTVASASARPSRSRDTHLPCGGSLEALNYGGSSPWSLYVQLEQPCLDGTIPATTCKCNLVVYNVYQASKACEQNSIESWSQWASQNLCNESHLYTTAPYDTSDVNLPKWAHQDLVNGQFDVTTAVQQAQGWSAIQIALPIIVGVVVALIAAVLFLWYRERHQGAFKGRRRGQKPWESANLHGPRRFFGLLPSRVTVKERSTRDAQWEIDGQTAANPVLDYDDDPAKDDGRTSRASGHSRTTSSSALIQSDASFHSAQSKSFFDTITSKISSMSLGRKYQNGAAKGSDYKRVNVVPRTPGDRFKIDGDLPTPNRRYDEPLVPPREEPAERQSSLPSVLDIRAPSVAAGSHRPWAGRYDSMPLSDDGRTDLAPPTIMHSDFSLGTTDLMTPISPSSGTRSSTDPHHASAISPNSPFLPSERFNPLPTIRASPSPYIERRESTDSLAHELYPRDPSHEY